MDAIIGREITSGPTAFSLNTSTNWTIPRCGIRAPHDAVISQEKNPVNSHKNMQANEMSEESAVKHDFNPQKDVTASSANRHGQDFVTKL
jgi:hypothetical protein